MKILAAGLLLLALSGCKSTAPSQTEDVSAGMDKEAIRQVIRENIVPIRHCYEKELKKNPKLSGKLILEWDVEDKGKVTRVSVKHSVNPDVDSCVADVIKAAKFPEPPKGQIGRIAFPFVFTSEEPKK